MPGDRCSNATVLSPTRQTLQFSTSGYLNDYVNDPDCGPSINGLDRYFTVTLAERMIIDARVSGTSATYPVIALVSGATCSSKLKCAASTSATTSRLVTQVLNPGQYTLVVDALQDPGATTYTLDLDFFAIGESCVSAPPLPLSQFTSSTVGHQNDLTLGCDDSGPDVVYAVTLSEPSAIIAVVYSPDAGFTPIVGILPSATSNTCGTAPLACSRRGVSPATAVTGVQPAGTYFVVVDGFDGGAGDFSLSGGAFRPDSCSQPTPLPVEQGSLLLRGKSTGLAPFSAGCTVGPAVLHSVVLSSPSVVTAKLNTPGSKNALFRQQAATCDGGTPEIIVCNSATNTVTTLGGGSAWPAGSYTIGVVTSATGGAYDLAVDFDSSIIGDSCASVGALASRVLSPAPGVPARAFDSTLVARDDSSSTCVASGGGDVVYRVVPQATGTLAARLTPLDGSIRGALYLKQSCGGPAELSCTLASSVGAPVAFTAYVQSGVEYFLWVDSTSPAQSGQFVLDLSFQ
jgi:hypothetical protein